MNLLEIAKSWIISFNPTNEQKQLAEERIKVCNNCENKEYLKTFNIYICNICKCPLEKKVYTPENTCPKNLWQK